MHIFSVKCFLCCCFYISFNYLFTYSCYLYFDNYFSIMMFTLCYSYLWSTMYIDTMLSVFQRHSCICQVIIWTPEGPISYASESLIVIFLPWYNCCVYVLNGNKMFLNWIESPGACGFDFKCVIFKCDVVITFMTISRAIMFRLMAQDLTDDKSLVQLLAWWFQTTGHYLKQYWCSLRSMAP